MLLTEFSTGWAVFFVLFCAFAVAITVFCVRLANYCRDAVNHVENQNKNAVSLRRMAEVEASLTDLTDSYDSLLKQHKRLRSRIGMRKIREDSQKPENDLHSKDKQAVRLAAKSVGLLK